jgi:hypothetical protein
MNEYDDLLAAEGQREQLRQSLYGAVGTNPDQYAEAAKLGRATGVPAEVVSRNLEPVKRKATLNEYDALLADSPQLAKRIAEDKDFARVSHDDVGTLTQVERAVRKFMAGGSTKKPVTIDPVMSSVQVSDTVRRMVEQNPTLDLDTARQIVVQRTQVENGPTIGAVRRPVPTAASVAGGIFNLDRQRAASAGVDAAIADAMDLDAQPALRRYSAAKARTENANPEFETATGQAIYGGLQSTVDQAGGIVLSVLTGSPAPALAALGAQTFASGYGKYRERGATGGQALTGGALEAGFEVVTEKLPMSYLVKKLGKVGAGEFLKGLLAREIPGEQLATLAQDAVDTAIANPDKTWEQYVAERPGAAYETLIATVTQAGVMASANVAAKKLAGPQEQADRAEQSAQGMEEFTQLMAASKLRTRDATTFTQFVQQLGESGETPTELYVDAQQLANTLQQTGVSIEQLREAAPQMVAQLQDGVPGADIRLPVAEVAALGPEITTPLIDHLREAPDAMSRAEAQQFMSEREAALKAEVERTLTQRDEAANFRQQVATVTAQFEQQLNDVGRFRPEVNKAYGAFMGNFYATQALRAGVPLEQMLQDYGLRVVGQTKAGALLDQDVPLQQTAPAITPETQAKIDDLGKREAVLQKLIECMGAA